MRIHRIMLLLFATAVSPAVVSTSLAETNTLCDSMTSYVDGDDWVKTLLQEQGEVRYYMYKTFKYPDYNANPMYQDIQNFAYSYSPAITFWEEHTDEDANTYRDSWWGTPNDPYPGTIEDGWYDLSNTFSAILTSTLDGMPSMTTFPIPGGSIPPDVQRYLQPGTYTQSDEPEIISHANSLVTGCGREYEAVSRVIDWCWDNLTYADGYPLDALWILQDLTHRAQCAGYSHMAIALLRAVGIPARYVGGFSIGEDYLVPTSGGLAWVEHLQGRHAWLEVYYPDTGWIPYEAQGFYHYVDTHVYKRCIGLDIEDRYPASRSYSWWGDPPLLSWGFYMYTGIMFDDNELEYYGTLATPGTFALGDRVIGIAGLQRDDGPTLARPLCSHPNPFRGMTTISYHLQTRGDADISIYSISGRLIWSYAAKHQPPGPHSVCWTGVNHLGTRVTSGVYLCTLTTETKTECHKIVVLQ